MLQVRENEISLRNWSGGTAHLRTLEETLFVMLCSTRLDTRSVFKDVFLQRFEDEQVMATYKKNNPQFLSNLHCSTKFKFLYWIHTPTCTYHGFI